LLHGDFKLANMLWGEKLLRSDGAPEATAPPLVIDWEWVGTGAAAQDLAYFLVSSADVQCLGGLSDGGSGIGGGGGGGSGDTGLVQLYHAMLPPAIQAAYPSEELVVDYELAILDLFRWLLGAKWSTLTPDGMAADARSYGRILPNRSSSNAIWLVQKVAWILSTNPVVLTALEQAHTLPLDAPLAVE
jgi:hypothetical protein